MTNQELYLDRLKKMQETVKKIKPVDSSKVVLRREKKPSIMQSIVINPKSNEEMKIVSDFLNRLHISSRVVTKDEMEDFGMAILMREVDQTRFVSEATILKKLKS